MAQVPDASTVPVPDVSPEEEALLFGSQGQPTAPAGGANPFASPPATPAQAHASPAGSQVGGVQAGNGLGEGNFQAIFLEMLRQQSQANQQNQQLIAALMRRMDLEEKRRNEAEEKAAETARLVAEAAARAKTEDPFAAATSTPSVPFAGATSSSSSVRSPLVQNRAEKYLPSLPMLEHQGMNKGRMREVETWHAYLETLSSWLALQDESFVRELQLCVKQKNEILQKDLADDVAARSAKLYYYLTQSLSRWERGQELLRSCSKRQSLSACGYEAVRTITQQYGYRAASTDLYFPEKNFRILRMRKFFGSDEERPQPSQSRPSWRGSGKIFCLQPSVLGDEHPAAWWGEREPHRRSMAFGAYNSRLVLKPSCLDVLEFSWSMCAFL